MDVITCGGNKFTGYEGGSMAELEQVRKELLDLRRAVKSLLGRPERENAWFAEYNFHPDDLYNMNENELYDKIEVFKGLVKRLLNSETVKNDEHAGTV